MATCILANNVVKSGPIYIKVVPNKYHMITIIIFVLSATQKKLEKTYLVSDGHLEFWLIIG